jgi:hypothetical protein
MFSRTACFVAASVFVAMGPAAAQLRRQGAPAAQGGGAAPQRKDRQSGHFHKMERPQSESRPKLGPRSMRRDNHLLCVVP